MTFLNLNLGSPSFERRSPSPASSAWWATAAGLLGLVQPFTHMKPAECTATRRIGEV